MYRRKFSKILASGMITLTGCSGISHPLPPYQGHVSAKYKRNEDHFQLSIKRIPSHDPLVSSQNMEPSKSTTYRTSQTAFDNVITGDIVEFTIGLFNNNVLRSFQTILRESKVVEKIPQKDRHNANSLIICKRNNTKRRYIIPAGSNLLNGINKDTTYIFSLDYSIEDKHTVKDILAKDDLPYYGQIR